MDSSLDELQVIDMRISYVISTQKLALIAQQRGYAYDQTELLNREEVSTK